MSAAWLTAFVALAVAVTGLLGWVARYGWRVTRRTMHFLDDWQGEPAHDGLPATPGVMARLAGVEALTVGINAEMHPNGGSSLRDVVTLTAARVAEIRDDQAKMRARMEQLETQRAGREKP